MWRGLSSRPYFITKPVFLLIGYLLKLPGNFGSAIFALTVITLHGRKREPCARELCALEAIPQAHSPAR